MNRKEQPQFNSSAKWLGIITAVHVLLCLIYWTYTPYGMPPDERPHGTYVQYLFEKQSLPVFSALDRENYEYHQPPLYYALGVPFYALGKAAGMTEPAQMVRLLSIILGILAIYAIFAVGRIVIGNEKLALAAAGFAALLPTHVMLSSSVSNDILVELIFSLAVLLMLGISINGPNPKNVIALGVVLGIGILAKTTCLILFPIAVLSFAIAWIRGVGNFGSAAKGALVVMFLGLLIGGWWLVRNHMLYGDFMAMSHFVEIFDDTAKPDYFLNQGLSITNYCLLVAGWTFASFWGVFGHMSIFMPTDLYFVLGFISLTVAIGFALHQIGLIKSRAGDMYVFIILHVTFLLVLAAFINFNLSFFQAQGRYLYPALASLSIFWVLGIEKLMPKKIKAWTIFTAVGIPLAIQVAALVTCIIRIPHI